MKKTICFIAVASLLLTTVSFCKNDKQEVKEESGKIRYTHPIQPAAIAAHTDFSFIF
ncbi:hypothetical protein KRR40_21160 [Niabella defluvii]|nr:hypothetical protein KRR40_21160 [Niabella sp. I65]